MSQHTPGPWVVTARQEREEFDDGTHMDRVEAYIGEPGRLAHCGKHVAKLMGWGRDFDRDPEMQANARLLAAAPDLFAAAEKFVRACKCEDADEDGDNCPQCGDLRAALAKAGGL